MVTEVMGTVVMVMAVTAMEDMEDMEGTVVMAMAVMAMEDTDTEVMEVIAMAVTAMAVTDTEVMEAMDMEDTEDMGVTVVMVMEVMDTMARNNNLIILIKLSSRITNYVFNLGITDCSFLKPVFDMMHFKMFYLLPPLRFSMLCVSFHIVYNVSTVCK